MNQGRIQAWSDVVAEPADKFCSKCKHLRVRYSYQSGVMITCRVIRIRVFRPSKKPGCRNWIWNGK